MTWEALVVGINQYLEDNLSNLEQAAADAEAIAECLEQHSTVQCVKRLPADEQEGKRQVAAKPDLMYPEQLPTTKNLRKAIISLLHLDSHNPPPDTILFYFSGHGFRDQNQGYLVTHDFNTTRNRWGIPLSWLARQLQKSPVKRQVIWLDCCHAGELLNCSELTSEESDYIRCIITSSRDNELSKEDLKKGHGTLTAALLHALDPKNPQNHPNGFVLSHDLKPLILQEFKQNNVDHIPQFFNSQTALILTQRQPQEYTGKSPYRDLRFFTEKSEDAEFYFGRETLTNQSIAGVKKNNFLAILGTTGSGKSSLIRAGLLYQLKQGQKIPGSNNWRFLGVIKPQEKPYDQLIKTLGKDSILKEVVNNFSEEKVILIIDQFEECFTLCQCEEQKQLFFKALTEALRQTHNKFCLVIGMRIDYLSNLLESRTGFTTYLADTNKQVWVTPLQQKELEQAITEPAKKAGLEVEPGLAITISNELLTVPRNLPLLQYVMTRIFILAKQSSEPRFLTRKMYESLGDIKDILKKRANKVYDHLGSEDEKLVARKIFLELTQLDQDRYTHRRVKQDTLINRHHPEELVEKVVNQLEEAGLITKDYDNQKIIEIAHESLISEWEKLHEWIGENQFFLKFRNEIERDTKTWKEQGMPQSQKSGFLLLGNKLYEAQSYLKRYGKLGYLSQDAEQFIQKSAEADQRNKQKEIQLIKEQLKQQQDAKNEIEKALKKEKQAKRQAQRRMWIVIFAAIGVLILGGITFESEQKAFQSEQKAQLREKVAEIRRLVNVNAFEALVRAIEATKSSQTLLGQGRVLPAVQGSLRESIQLALYKEVWVGHEGAILSVAVHPLKNNLIATGGSDSKVWIWNRNNYPLVRAHDTQQTSINAVIFSQNGDVITGGIDGSIKVWKLKDDHLHLTHIFKHQSAIFALAAHPKKDYIASSDTDGTVKLWNLQTQESENIPLGHKGTVRTLAFSADGEYLVSGGDDGKVKRWNQITKKLEDILSQKNTAIQSVAVSFDGQYIATGSEAGEITIWNQNSGKITTLPNPSEGINSLAVAGVNSLSFSSNNQYLVSGGEDQVVRVWNLENYQLKKEFRGHGQAVNAVRFSPDDQYIYSGSDDTYLRFWSLEENPQFGNWWTHNNRVTSVSASGNGQIVFGSEDDRVFIWEKNKREATPLPQNPNYKVNAVAISQDGKLIVSGRQRGFLTVWTDRNAKPFIQIEEDAASISSVAMTPDGNWIVSGSESGTVRLLQLENNQIKLNKIPPSQDEKQSAIKSVAISDSGNKIAFGNEQGEIKLWNQTTKEIKPLTGHKGAVNAVTFSSDEKYLISAGKDKTVRVWDTEKHQQVGNPLRGHRRGVNSVIIVSSSTDEFLLASGGEGGTLRLWMWNTKEEKGQHIAQLVQEYKGAINALAMDSSGKQIISAAGNEIRLWQGGTWKTWLKTACRIWTGEKLDVIDQNIHERAESTCQLYREN